MSGSRSIKILVGGIALLVLAGGVWFMASPDTFLFSNEERQPTVSAPSHESDQEQLRTYWSERIEAVGGEEAYQEFGRAYGDISSTDQHNLAHIFGGVLYSVEGVDGFSVCDGSYQYGCYHEFLGQAIFQEGMQVTNALNEGCREDLGPQALSCQHGIGHGILAAVGYEDEQLLDAIHACRELPHNDPIGGCYGGVFMEYNMRTMLSLDGVPPREQNSDDLLETCKGMPDYAKGACYYWQPQWWLSIYRSENMDRMEAHRAIGDLCEQAETAELRDTCFKGIGNNVIMPGLTPERAAALCQAATPDLRSEVLCRADAANSFAVVPELENSALQVCDGLEGKYHKYCSGYSRNEFNILNEGEL